MPIELIWSHQARADLIDLYPESDEGPVDAVEVIRVIDGRRNLHGII
ncbi:hypothetical protein [Bradyrhizobium sp. HKCCYLS20291]